MPMHPRPSADTESVPRCLCGICFMRFPVSVSVLSSGYAKRKTISVPRYGSGGNPMADSAGSARMEHGVDFGGFRFEPSSGRLWFGEREIRLTPKAAGVLATLVGRAGELVTKQELFSSLWGDVAVSDD